MLQCYSALCILWIVFIGLMLMGCLVYLIWTNLSSGDTKSLVCVFIDMKLVLGGPLMQTHHVSAPPEDLLYSGILLSNWYILHYIVKCITSHLLWSSLGKWACLQLFLDDIKALLLWDVEDRFGMATESAVLFWNFFIMSLFFFFYWHKNAIIFEAHLVWNNSVH